MSQTLAKVVADDILKTVFLSPFRTALNNALSVTYSQIERGSKNVTSQELRFSIETGRSGGTGSIGEMGDLPTADRQKSRVIDLGLKSHYGTVQFTGQLMKLATSNEAVFINAVEREMSGIQTDLMQERQRQIWNDSDSALVYASGNHASNVIPVANATPRQLRSLVVGASLDIGTSANPVSLGTAVVITAIDRTNLTITVTGTLGTLISGSVIRKHDSFENELTGIQAIVGKNNSLYGVNGATEYVWNSYVNENGGTPRALTALLLQSAMDEMMNEHGKSADLCVTDHAVMRAYSATIDDRNRFVDSVELKDGYTGIQVYGGDNSCVLTADRFSPEGMVHLLSTSDLYFNEASDWDWIDDDGAILSRIDGKHAFTATIYKFDELTTDQRNGHGVIKDLSGATA